MATARTPLIMAHLVCHDFLSPKIPSTSAIYALLFFPPVIWPTSQICHNASWISEDTKREINHAPCLCCSNNGWSTAATKPGWRVSVPLGQPHRNSSFALSCCADGFLKKTIFENHVFLAIAHFKVRTLGFWVGSDVGRVGSGSAIVGALKLTRTSRG